MSATPLRCQGPGSTIKPETTRQRARTRATTRRAGITIPTHCRVRRDKIDKAGHVTLRYHSRLLHIGVGRDHTGTRVLLLIADRDVRVITEHGELLQQLTIDPTKNYNPIDDPKSR